jgi:hypothetical protein
MPTDPNPPHPQPPTDPGAPPFPPKNPPPQPASVQEAIEILATAAFLDPRFYGDAGIGLRTVLKENFGIDGSAATSTATLDRPQVNDL